MGASKSSSSSKPVDMTPQVFKDLQGPLAKQLESLISQFGKSGAAADIMKGYDGETVAGTTANEDQTLNMLQSLFTGGQNGQPAQSGNATTNSMLENMQQAGSSAQSVADYVSQLGIGGQSQSLADFLGNVNGASTTGAFTGNGADPFTQAYIAAAQRQTLQALEETLSRTLPSRFALAGQQTQPGSSSAFDRAAAIATRGAADAIGDIATKISYQNLADTKNREASLIGDQLNRQGQQDLQTQQLTAAAQQSTLDRALEASKTGAQVQAQEVDNLIKNLQAQALPRLIDDLGIERGMEVFNNRINSILATLGIGAGVTRPVIGNTSQSSSGGFQLK